ncbi:MAG: hypothetical protein ACOY5R_01815 [Pseudomonadota bacterium]|uniref:hypothetical protein n=1 Tax=Rhizorhabdus phycosphaerae TaxID=2711156 RepID=UPI0013ECC236|nr:hypothetical protein [Rhizorhabdus phycosphaerae]
MTNEKTSGEAGSKLRGRAAEARAFAEDQLRRTSEVARQAGHRAADQVDAFPVAALVGGLAVGAVLGAMLPRTRQEEQLLGTIGETIADRAREAVAAARDAGQEKLSELGISSDAAGKQVGRLIGSIAEVAETAGSAAVDAVRK